MRFRSLIVLLWLGVAGCTLSDLTDGTHDAGTTTTGGSAGNDAATGGIGGGAGATSIACSPKPTSGRWCDLVTGFALCADFDEKPAQPLVDGWQGFSQVRGAADSAHGTSVTREASGCNGSDGAVLSARANPTNPNDRYADCFGTLPSPASDVTIQADIRLGDAAGTGGFKSDTISYLDVGGCQALLVLSSAESGIASYMQSADGQHAVSFEPPLGQWHRLRFEMKNSTGTAEVSVDIDEKPALLPQSVPSCGSGGGVAMISIGLWLPGDAEEMRVDDIQVTAK